MPVQDIPFVIGVIAAFALFGITLAYVNLIAGARATTFEQERAARMATRDMLADRADTHGWSRLMLNAPRLPEDGRKLYEKIASAADHTSWQMSFDQNQSPKDRG